MATEAQLRKLVKRLVRSAVESAGSDTLTIERSGEFLIETRGENHCGTKQNLKVRYKLVCTCANKLDFRGFLFDQLKVDDFFQGILATSFSCEKLTVESLELLLTKIVEENPECEVRGATLTLSPEPFAASMTYKIAFPKKKAKKLAK